MRLAITGILFGKSMINGEFGLSADIVGKVLFVTITYAEHEKEPPRIVSIYFVDGKRILPDENLFSVLDLPETCAKNKSGEVVCVTHQKFFPGQQNQAAALELAHCPCCGNRLIVFEDAPIPI